MLDVPKEIKELLKQSSVKKNIRVSFPFDDIPDLTNNEVITESLKFNESICSRNEIKFGLCEASSVEFQCALADNVKGKIIDVSLEILDEYIVQYETREYIAQPGEKFIIPTLDFECNEIEIKLSNPAQSGILRFKHTVPLTYWGSYDEEGNYTETPYYDDGLIQDFSVIPTRELKIKFGFAISAEDTPYFSEYELNVPAGTVATVKYTKYSKLYPINIGTFIVDECKRDATDMNLRNIVAYSQQAQMDWKISNQYNLRKLLLTYDNATPLSQNLECFILSEFPTLAFDILEKKYAPAVRESNGSSILKEIKKPFYDVSLQIISKKVSLHNYGKKDLFGVDFSKYPSKDAVISICKHAIDQAISVIEPYETVEKINEIREKSYKKVEDSDDVFFSALIQNLTFVAINNTTIDSVRSHDNLNQCNKVVIYPYGDRPYRSLLDLPTGKISCDDSFSVVSGLILYASNEKGVKYSTRFGFLENNEQLPIYKFDTSELNDVSFEIEKIKNPSFKNGWYNIKTLHALKEYPFDNIQNVLEAMLELRGGFGVFERNGDLRLKKLPGFAQVNPSNNLFPSNEIHPSSGAEIVVTKSMYSQFWYDDEDMKGYSKLVCNYNNSEDDDSDTLYEEWLIEPSIDEDGNEYYDEAGYQIYEINNNYYMRLQSFTEEEVKTLLKPLAESLKSIRYRPIELDMIGMPFIQAGDTISIETSNGFVNSYVFTNNITGIQSLKQIIESN